MGLKVRLRVNQNSEKNLKMLLMQFWYFLESIIEIMEEKNALQIIFSFMILLVLVFGGLMHSFERHLPIVIRQCLRYGKFAYTGEESFIKPIKVPKSWFKHFYMYSSIITILAFFVCIFVFVLDYDVPVWLNKILNVTCGSNRYASVSATCSLLAMCLLTLQCGRRCYDTSMVSVFGKNSYMDLSHYLIGYVHYTGSVIAILSEAPKFAYSNSTNLLYRWSDLNVLDFIAAGLFLWAWWYQYKSTVILANLRKNKKGEIVTQEHQLPRGDWFEYVSCPHMFAEILMYFSLAIILWGNMNWFYVFSWVFVNQFQVALMNHWWYQEKFDDLPKHRKALIPFIY